MNRADYEVGTLESKVELEVNNAIKSLDNLISKIDSVKSVLSSALNINGIKEITQFTNSINKIPNALNEINKVDMTKVDSQFMSLGNTVSSFTTQLREANTMANSTQTVLQSVISSFNALPSAMSKVEKIDNRQLYSSLSSTSRATEEFSGSLYTSLSNIPQALKEVQNMDLKSLYDSFDNMTRMLEPFTTKMNETFKGMTDTITPFIDKVKELNTELGKMSGLSDEIGDNAEKSITKTNKVLNENNKQNKKIDFGDAVKSTVKLGAIFGVLRKGFNTVKDITSASIDMIETTNLFEVQMGKVVDEYGNLDEAQSTYYTKAMAFQDEMNEKLATNKSEMQRYQAMYYGMLNSQLGSKNRDASYMMSESLTKAGYDIASLYNLDVETAMNKLKSGLAGQIESLRQIGIDVSEASLSKVLDQVGIERSVQQLSYAEKEVARYIAICQQAGKAQGDFARTFEQPANQIRVFQNQLLELKQVAGSFIVNAFGGILVYVNAIIMVIKEIIKSLASLFGYNLDVGGSNITASLGDVSDGVSDVGSGLGKATKQAKEFKKQLMGFDEINNIEPPTQSAGGGSSGGGGGISGGIDDKLLNSLKEWDNMMSKISGKAQEIRDKILDWLGVTDGSYDNLKRIWEIIQTIGVAFGTWKVSKAITDLLKNLGILNKTQAFQIAFGLTLLLTGIFAQYKGTKRLLNGDINLFSILETILGTTSGALGIVSLLKATKFGKALSLGNKLKVGFGIMLAIQGVQVLLDGIKTKDIKKTILGSLESIASLSIAFNGLFGKNLITSIKNTIASVSSFGIMTVSSFKNARASGLSLGKSFISAGKDAMSLIPTSVKVAGGLAGLAVSVGVAYSSMKELKEGSIGTTEALLKAGSSIAGAAASGALLGSVIPRNRNSIGSINWCNRSNNIINDRVVNCK